ncbi:hypothetical protein Tco_1287932, partial [Tanacetum coccineum]
EVTDKAGEKRNIVKEAVVVTDAVTILVSAATITNVELTLAQTLAELKSARPKIKGVVMQEPSESNPIISLQLPSQVKGQGSKDKGKALLTGRLEDLETLWKLVKAKHAYTRPEEGYERVLWGDLKTMFEHHIEDAVWRNLREIKVLVWKLFDSCGLHFVRIT